ncbi:MAG: RNA methyltransferase [Acidobacteriaceae bacterium]|nr:RNA methyltransferase [Acidobacteriaceae bacterium]
MRLTSIHNPRLQEIRRAAISGRPTPDGLVVAEGPHLLEEVLRSSWGVEEVFCTAEASIRFSDLIARTRITVTDLSPRAFESVATTETTQGLLALLRPRAWTFEETIAGNALTVICDAIQDPGNAGTIARSAEAFGATGILLTDGCARVSNGKVLRAAAGSLFRIPYLESVTRSQISELFAGAGLRVYSLTAESTTPLFACDLRGPCALQIGNEGTGLSPELLTLGSPVSIPTARVESLNAAVACSIALFEAARQRNAK